MKIEKVIKSYSPMTVKKWRPLWSYDVEKTERWLSDMAAEGEQLTAINRLTRIFTFTSRNTEKVNYQVVYDKSESELPNDLRNTGWEVAASARRWKIVKNAQSYFDMHKSAGWQLKFTAVSRFTKYSLWAQSYEEEGGMPHFTTSDEEKKAQDRKATVTVVWDFLYAVVFAGLIFLTSYWSYQEGNLTFIKKVLLLVGVVLFIVATVGVIRSLKYAIRMRKI